MILKPAEDTPLTALAIGAILQEAGLPVGVLNVVTTSRPSPATETLFTDQRLRKVSFTGSTEVGRIVLDNAADHVLRTSLELGGNAPFMVFGDADLDAAVDGAMVAKMRNMGEACTAANRFYVAKPLAEEFATLLGERMSALVVGHGAKEESQVGPLINEEGRIKVETMVNDMVSRGGRVVTGGLPATGSGYFYTPTLIADVPAESLALTQEIFGPVAPVMAFNDEVEAVSLANQTEYGLVAYLYTRDLGRAFRVSEQLEAGMVGLNTGLVSNPAAPFGGMKQSGLGREGGFEGIEEFLATKYVSINWLAMQLLSTSLEPGGLLLPIWEGRRPGLFRVQGSYSVVSYAHGGVAVGSRPVGRSAGPIAG